MDLKQINLFGQGGFDKDANYLEYAYPCENYISVIISNPGAKYSLKKFFDRKIKGELQKIAIASTEITDTSSPRIFGIIRKCCETLAINSSPKYYISPKLKGINSLTVGDDDNPVLLISPLAVARLNNREMAFLIGHELGHIAQKNLICHTVKGALDAFSKWSEAIVPIMADLIEVPLNRWYRCAEFTADRAGLLCCGNLQSALDVFEKVANHLPSSNSTLEDYQELSSDHPTISNRINELKEFSQKKL